MNDNKFTGSIDRKLHNLINLQVLDLSNNQLSGVLEEDIFDHMIRLTHLKLNDNQLKGTIPLTVVHLAGASKYTLLYAFVVDFTFLRIEFLVLLL